MKYLKQFKPDLTFNDIDNQFYNELITDCNEKNIQTNSVGSRIKCLKVYMKYAVDKEYTTNMKYIGFKKPTTETNILFFTKDEVSAILNYNPSINFVDTIKNKKVKNNPKFAGHNILQRKQHLIKQERTDRTIDDLKLVRDLTIVGISTGLRFSDVVSLNSANFIIDSKDSSFIMVQPHKTRRSIQIPINSILWNILERNAFNFSAIVGTYKRNIGTNQRFSIEIQFPTHHLHHFIRVEYKEFVGNQQMSTACRLYEIVSSHMMRKTFITLNIIAGVPHTIIMEVSGHESYAAFKRYVNVSNRDILRRVTNVFDEI
jgi:site-specific recombinase XerD